MNIAEDDSDYCLAHGGRIPGDEHEQREYLLAQVKERFRLAKIAGVDQIKSLVDEIAIVRDLAVRIYDSIKSDADLLKHSGQLNTLLLTAERLKKSNIAFEQSGGTLLSKETVVQLGQEICAIIIKELAEIENYEQIVDRVSDQIADVIVSAQNVEV
jgi:hypothetical protein